MAEKSNVIQENNSAIAGLNLDSTLNQVQKGRLTYALNAVIENFDGQSVNYQNELGNELCFELPTGYILNGKYYIPELTKQILFLVNPTTGDSEVGYMDNNDCIYKSYINDPCLGFDPNFPILKIVHRITDCTTEIYWTDANKSRRYLDLNNLPYKIKPGTNVCDNETVPEIDCNKLRVQPDYSIPNLEVTGVVSGGNLTTGTVQFAFQYADAQGNPYTQYYSITNPTPIADPQLITPNFNYPVGKSVILNISNIEISGNFEYFNLAVIKTVNAITSVELIGTYFIDNSEKQIVYNGSNQTQIRLTVDDIFRKYPFYDVAGDVTVVQDVIVWDQLTSVERINYQKIANKIKLQWQTYRIPATEDYSDELNATNLRGYLRDEVYPLEISFQLTNGKETDGFHIPGRVLSPADESYGEVSPTNPDFIGEPDPSTGTSPYWKIYNTATVTETDPAYVPYSDYKGPYQTGEFAYWESTELYPCNEEVWGELANTPIRHHKFPDLKVSPIFENPVIEIGGDGKYSNLAIQKNAIFPIGIKINVQEVQSLILSSDLTPEQKEQIVGFKILRGNRDTNKSIVAKGILRNVGKYEREGTEYYFPNYPYNDLREDPFLLEKSNAYTGQCNVYELTVSVSGDYQYTDCFTNDTAGAQMNAGDVISVCSITKPVVLSGNATIVQVNFDTYQVVTYDDNGGFEGIQFSYDKFPGNDVTIVNLVGGQKKTVKVMAGTTITVLETRGRYSINQISSFDNAACYPNQLNAFTTDDSKYRQVFNSPETSFGQPFLGDVLKVENVLFGQGKAHFVEVKKNALYKLLSKEAQEDALLSSEKVAAIGSFDGAAMFTAYQSYLQIYVNGITRRNYGWSYNSILDYDYFSDVDNGLGIKQRKIESSQYLYPGVQSVNDDLNINNYQRETSVYIKTTDEYSPLPYPSQTPSLLTGAGESMVEDRSRFINSEIDCTTPEKQFDISSVLYYASIKNNIVNQWGQMYSYETIDTGFQTRFDNSETYKTIFGGDTFISKFAFKTKLPFFIDNRVGAPDDSDIYYDEIGNIAYPEFWHSARSILYDYDGSDSGRLSNIISIKAHNFDCPNNQLPVPDPDADPPIVNPDRTFYDGKMYMFAYGIPIFHVESSVNVDLRQAFNTREGEFYPHVSSGIPDDWVQESFVTIAQDNTYYYNVTFSKQNEENFFSHLPVDWTGDECDTKFPFRSIFSDDWLTYLPLNYFDFPQNYGKLTSLDGIQNGAVLARFENKSLLYNTLLTIDTSNPKAAYLGGGNLFTSSPPIDFAETDLGYVGSQHKFLLKIPQGQVTVDAKRGQIFLISGNSAQDISAFGSGLNRFLKDHLPFEILKYFPNVNIDNNFNGIGLHGVYDSKFNRIIITKLDYIPTSNKVKYDDSTKEFYIEEEYAQYPTTSSTTTSGTTTTTSTTSTTTTLAPIKVRKVVNLTDNEYFCNKSWTISFNMNTMTWISFHSYIPNWYIAENGFFYSGINEGCDLDIIAAEIVPPTTTTTTTAQTFDCDLEGEIETIECELAGNAILLYDCELEGEANLIETTTTTTTTL